MQHASSRRAVRHDRGRRVRPGLPAGAALQRRPAWAAIVDDVALCRRRQRHDRGHLAARPCGSALGTVVMSRSSISAGGRCASSAGTGSTVYSNGTSIGLWGRMHAGIATRVPGASARIRTPTPARPSATRTPATLRATCDNACDDVAVAGAAWRDRLEPRGALAGACGCLAQRARARAGTPARGAARRRAVRRDLRERPRARGRDGAHHRRRARHGRDHRPRAARDRCREAGRA